MRNSQDYPLRIDSVAIPDCDGRIGMTFCPGKHQRGALSGDWQRDLQTDLAAIRRWGASVIVNLLEDHEMTMLNVCDTRQRIPAGMEYLRLPIPDVGIPGTDWEAQWRIFGPFLRRSLVSGNAILLHCKGGLGRTGMVAARLLVEMGYTPDHAISAVRSARANTIETTEQEGYVRALAQR